MMSCHTVCQYATEAMSLSPNHFQNLRRHARKKKMDSETVLNWRRRSLKATDHLIKLVKKTVLV